MRRAILKITPVLLGEMFRDGEHHIKIESGLPEDAKFIGAWYNHEKTCFDLCYESAEFADVKEGELLRVLAPPKAIRLEVEIAEGKDVKRFA